MDLGLAGRGYLVLGASRGIGLAVGEALVSEGASVVLGARSESSLAAAQARLSPRATTVVCDVADPDLGALVASVASLPSFDGILVSSGGPPLGNALDLASEVWLDTFKLLVAGPLAILQELVPRLDRPASVVFIGSMTTRQPVDGLDTSNVVRPCIPALAKTLARQFAPDVRFNVLLPGRIDTDRIRENVERRAAASETPVDELWGRLADDIPYRRLGSPEEVGRVAAFLLSPASTYVTGESLLVDGALIAALH